MAAILFSGAPLSLFQSQPIPHKFKCSLNQRVPSCCTLRNSSNSAFPKDSSLFGGGSRDIQKLTFPQGFFKNERRNPFKLFAQTEPEKEDKNIPFGYTRKDVILIGVGILVIGVSLKYGLEFAGLDPLQSGNVVQLVFVLGLMLAWTATYVFRVGNKEMTYVQQLKDYEDAVMKKRLEELPETELEAMLAEVEEEKIRLREKRAKKKSQ